VSRALQASGRSQTDATFNFKTSPLRVLRTPRYIELCCHELAATAAAAGRESRGCFKPSRALCPPVHSGRH